MSLSTVAETQISEKLIGRWGQVCEKIQALAEEVPAEKFDYRPTQNVRSVAEVLRHVTFWNQYVAGCAKGESPDGSANELPGSELSTKTQIIRALKDSAAEARGAFEKRTSGLNAELAETLVTFIEHTCEHYGQLAMNARLNGIVPPASRG